MNDVDTRFNRGWLFVGGLVVVLLPLTGSTIDRGGGFLDMRGFMVAVVLLFSGVLSLAMIVALFVLRAKQPTSSTWPTALLSAAGVVAVALSSALTSSTQAPAALAASIGVVVAAAAFVSARPPIASWWIVLTPTVLMITGAVLFLIG